MNSGRSQVRLAVPSDSPQIVKIIQYGFPRGLLPYTILNCRGIVKFVSDVIRFQSKGDVTTYVVYEDREGFIVGVAEFRRIIDGLFLNHFYVQPLFQGRGIGRTLLLEGINLTRESQTCLLALDVFVDNERSRKWYEAQGLRPVLERVWIQKTLPPPAKAGNYWWSFANLPQAGITQAVYEFSQFDLLTRSRTYKIGRLGIDLFRSTNLDIFSDIAALEALRSLDSKRRLLCIDSIEGLSTTLDSRGLLAISQRLEGNVDEVLSNLTRAQPGWKPRGYGSSERRDKVL